MRTVCAALKRNCRAAWAVALAGFAVLPLEALALVALALEALALETLAFGFLVFAGLKDALLEALSGSLDSFEDQAMGVLDPAPAEHLNPFPGFEVLVVLE